MKCSRCGFDCPDTSNKCTRCGAVLPQYQAPQQPQYQAPQQPQYQAPQQPQYQAPQQPQYQAPQQPQYQAPQQPQYQAPQQPQYQAPQQPQYQAPQQPQYQAPQQPQYQAPQQPQYQAPQQPQYQTPVQENSPDQETAPVQENAPEGKKKKSGKKTRVIIAAIAAVVVVILAIGIGIGSGGGTDEPANEETTVSEEEAKETNYNTFLGYINSKDYANAVKTYDSVNIKGYKDADAYYAYAKGEHHYSVGAVGLAYEDVKDLTLPAAQEFKTKVTNELSGLQGLYKADNGQGSYLWMKIEGGKIYQDLVGYYDDVQTPDFSLSARYVLSSEYTTGEKFYAIGNYYTTKGCVIDYAITTYSYSTDLLIIRFEGNEYSTFNGLYVKQN